MVRKILYICVILCISTIAFGQKPFAKAYINRTQVYKTQPVRLTIKVYSPRWFTQGLQFDKLKVNDAFIVPFTQTLAGKEIVNRHSYAVLTFFYLVYPYETGVIKIPKVPVTAYIPTGNSYKETKIKLTTNTISFRSIPLPQDERTIVSSNVFIQDKWNRPFSNLNEGDVLEREITITAYGTIPNFIPYIEMEDVPFAKIYKTQDFTQQNIDKESGSVISKRIEKFSYLLTDNGKFVMPGTKLSFFNPYLGNYKEKSSMSSDIVIKKNAQLGIVASMADSLEKQQARMVVATPKVPFKKKMIRFIVQNKWKLLGLILILLSLKFIFNTIMLLIAKIAKRKETYINSERHAFYQLIKEGKFNSPKYLTKLYHWLYKLPKREASIMLLAHKTKNETIRSIHERIFAKIYRNKKVSIKEHFAYTLRKFRNQLRNKKREHTSHLEDW
ncbi:BatD family protein [Halosquirtibacter xylanolyticus]|uniref:hypothetical protein n=1 Tax=Halosquirtibacter xylanolyticus TaxID=3374599 RepID=UPI00374A95D0|nr:BatD family protein [Prolixibacteraceae bacterium]